MQAASSLTLARSQILRDRKEIQSLFTKTAFKLSSKTCHVRFVHLNEDQATRVLFVAPKKKYRSAVKRNRIKRVMRESYRLQQDNLALTGLNIAFIYTGPYPINYNKTFKEIGDLISNIKDAS